MIVCCWFLGWHPVVIVCLRRVMIACSGFTQSGDCMFAHSDDHVFLVCEKLWSFLGSWFEAPMFPSLGTSSVVFVHCAICLCHVSPRVVMLQRAVWERSDLSGSPASPSCSAARCSVCCGCIDWIFFFFVWFLFSFPSPHAFSLLFFHDFLYSFSSVFDFSFLISQTTEQQPSNQHRRWHVREQRRADLYVCFVLLSSSA